MSRLIKPPKTARSKFAPRLTPKQEAARKLQAHNARKGIVLGLLERRAQHRRGAWQGMQAPRSVSKSETRMQMASRIFGGAS